MIRGPIGVGKGSPHCNESHESHALYCAGIRPFLRIAAASPCRPSPALALLPHLAVVHSSVDTRTPPWSSGVLSAVHNRTVVAVVLHITVGLSSDCGRNGILS